MTTDFSKKIDILSEFFSLYREDKQIEDFIEFNDVGLPLAWLSSEGLCEINEDGKKYVAETWEVFLLTVGIAKDEGFENLDEVMAQASIGSWPGDK